MASSVANSLVKVRERVLADHQLLYAQLEGLDRIATIIERDAGTVAHDAERLRREVREMASQFERHLAYEDSRLVPLIAKLEDWGPARVREMRKEHGEQREMLRILVSESKTTHALTLANEVLVFVRCIRADMNSEERDLRQLGEDSTRVDQYTG